MSTATLAPASFPASSFRPVTSPARADLARREARRQLYLRRRVMVLVGVVLAVALALGVANAGVQASDGTAPVLAEPVTYVVQPGDTLWSIAADLAPDRDPRPIVQRLESSAGTSLLQVGQALVIPGDLVG